MAVIGIDPSSGRRPAGLAVLKGDGRLVELASVPMTALDGACACYRGALVAIDCPLWLPRGLHCLDPAHGCPDGMRRPAEVAVAALGIPLYWTTRRSIIAPMIQLCIRLRERLERAGHIVIEVYPYAVKRGLFGDAIPRKTTPAGLAWLRQRVAGLVNDPRGGLEVAGHDELDAAVAAYAGWLHLRGLARALGDQDDGGTIVVPESLLRRAQRGTLNVCPRRPRPRG